MRSIKKIICFFIVFVAVALILGGSARLMFPVKYQDIVIKHAINNNLNPSLVFSVIKVESNFQPNAVSRKDARGLMQIMEQTALWASRELKMENFEPDDLFDPETNIIIGCWYLRKLMDEFANDTDLAIAAYNGGSGNVKQWLSNSAYSSTGATLDIIPFKETEKYIKRVKNCMKIYDSLYGNKF